MPETTLPVIWLFTFDDLHEILSLQADLEGTEPPTRGQILDLVDGWMKEAAKAHRKRVEERTLDILRAKQAAMKSVFLSPKNGHNGLG
jgi:hypothetical protein